MKFCAHPGCPVKLADVGPRRCPQHARAKEATRPNAEARKWYHLARWRKLRALVLSEQPLCRVCVAHGRVTPSRDVDHITPHQGDVALFWDRDNLQGLCASCHSVKTHAEEIGY